MLEKIGSGTKWRRWMQKELRILGTNYYCDLVYPISSADIEYIYIYIVKIVYGFYVTKLFHKL